MGAGWSGRLSPNIRPAIWLSRVSISRPRTTRSEPQRCTPSQTSLLLLLLAANEQIGQAAKSWRSAGQYSRPKKMICRWRAFQVSSGNTALRSRSVRSTLEPSDRPQRRGEAVDVRVDRERRHAERLRHHDAGRLVPDAGKRLEELPVRRAPRRRRRRSGWPPSRCSSPSSAPARPRGSRLGSPRARARPSAPASTPSRTAPG